MTERLNNNNVRVWSWHRRSSGSSLPSTLLLTSTSTERNLDRILDDIEAVSVPDFCTRNSMYRMVDVDLPTTDMDPIRDKTLLSARLFGQFAASANEHTVTNFANATLNSDPNISTSRLLVTQNSSLASARHFQHFSRLMLIDAPDNKQIYPLSAWYNITEFYRQKLHWHSSSAGDLVGTWSQPYYSCEQSKWLVAYTVFIPILRHNSGAFSVLSVEMDTNSLDIDQCESNSYSVQSTRSSIVTFHGTHRCHNQTSVCIFEPNRGWTRGSYSCECRPGFYAPGGSKNRRFNGTAVEAAFKLKKLGNRSVYSLEYDKNFVCHPCASGCEVCNDGSPCLSPYNWPFRIILLTISVICIAFTMVLAFYVYRYRKLKVIKVASPIFLCITLLGCAIMYCEMAAIFPVLDVYCCIATKWTRHMGFCITFCALVLKTWRVSLTYRVKSAHKLKLTDKQLLQWLFPILLEMSIFLGTWTIASPPDGIYIDDANGLKFKICRYNWWDHTMAIAEFFFLVWGIRVCYQVRHAESFFNEATHVTWAIYNITITNMFMMLLHLVILPKAGPDVKYLLGFVRTQLSTTVTIILIFGPKFYRVLRGQGDTWEVGARGGRGAAAASFALNGVGLMHEETTDLYQENEELKEEIQKLAAQIEFMKIVHMEINNRHLKPKHSSFFSTTNSTQSPVVKAMYMKFESTADAAGSRISPAAELVSERV